MKTQEQMIQDLRVRIFAAIKKELEEDFGCKSYEGAVSVTQSYGNYFEPDRFRWIIHLDCYVLGPNRHYDWWGNTFEEVIEKVHAELDKWGVSR